jgi:hypothetical protein
MQPPEDALKPPATKSAAFLLIERAIVEHYFR